MFRNFQLICEAFHLHNLLKIMQERALTEEEQKVFNEIEKRGVGKDSELEEESSLLLTAELERFKAGVDLIVVPDYVATSIRILNDSIPEVDDILSNL